MSSAEPIISIRNLTRLSDQQPSKPIVNDVSFSFFAGKIYSIVGPSGSGKSSLLRLINRLDEPTSGTITFKGKSQCDYSPCELRKSIGYLFQVPYLFDGTVAENLRYANSELSDSDLEELLNAAHLEGDLLHASVERLSLGEKQRVSLARMLATDPTVILLDEPTSALDPTHVRLIEDTIKEILSDKKRMVIWVTHDPTQAMRVADEVLLIVNSRIVEHGSVEDILNNPQTEAGKKYREGYRL